MKRREWEKKTADEPQAHNSSEPILNEFSLPKPAGEGAGRRDARVQAGDGGVVGRGPQE